ncbi:hypothetical protein RQP46_010662 [Phenoliferia psychrophenolica]
MAQTEGANKDQEQAKATPLPPGMVLGPDGKPCKPSFEEKGDLETSRGVDVRSVHSDSGNGGVEEGLHRNLEARQITMIALGGAIGTGLIIGSGSALARAGPVGMLIGYVIMGAVCYSVMISLGEMATYLPGKRGFAGYLSRFADPALGTALGYNYLFKYLIGTPNNLTAASLGNVPLPSFRGNEPVADVGLLAQVVQFWIEPSRFPIAAWISIFIVVIVAINCCGVRVFGEVEFWMSLFKIITLTGLIIFGIVIDLGGGPSHDRIGFRYWKHPFSHYLLKNDTGVFLGVWAVMVNALFAYMGCEMTGVTFGEARNPRKAVPAAIRRTFWRLLISYIGSIFVVGLIVPYNDPRLLAANKKSNSASASPFVVASTVAGVKVLPQILNACILVFVLSAANSDLYIVSRTLYGLATERKAPSIFLRCNRFGVPYVALAFCSLFIALAYLNVSQASKVVFGYFTAVVTMFGAITWMGILYAHIRFMQALKAQGISRDTLPYKAWGQPYLAWTGLIITAIVAFFKGFDSFIPTFNKKTFITNYIGLPVFVAIWLGWKLWYGTTMISLRDVDLTSGRREIDEEEVALNAADDAAWAQKSAWRKVWEVAA